MSGKSKRGDFVEQSLQKQIEFVTRQAAEAVSRVLDKEDTDAKTVRDMVAALKDLSSMVREQDPETVRIVLERDVDGFSE